MQMHLKSKSWFKYTGEYEKVHYDIKLKNTGTEIKACWPNAGEFHTMNGIRIKGEDVDMIKATDDRDHPWK